MGETDGQSWRMNIMVGMRDFNHGLGSHLSTDPKCCSSIGIHFLHVPSGSLVSPEEASMAGMVNLAVHD